MSNQWGRAPIRTSAGSRSSRNDADLGMAAERVTANSLRSGPEQPNRPGRCRLRLIAALDPNARAIGSESPFSTRSPEHRSPPALLDRKQARHIRDS